MSLFTKQLKFDEHTLTEIQELNRIASAERFKADQVAKNTALFKDGKKLAAQLDGVAKICESFKDQYVSMKLTELGVPTGQKTSVDLKTGIITPQA